MYNSYFSHTILKVGINFKPEETVSRPMEVLPFPYSSFSTWWTMWITQVIREFFLVKISTCSQDSPKKL